ncbi:uracil-DNA glycosylase [Pseudoduganella sp. LjRoot289]|uniref:uracil-DNA glycosylase n=1 Tax=Pseudoduganella sp. LjRoot289 TaxID=3342314 RepID=UPI003ECE5FA3
MSRSEVFLREMGVGAQWRLRNRPAHSGGELEYIDADAPDELIEQDDAAAAHSGQAPVAASRTPTAQEWIAAHDMPAEQPAMAPPAAPAAQAARQAQAAQYAQAAPPLPVAQNAQFPRPAAPAQPAPPASPASASGDDTAWFDDAPVPAARPAPQPAAPKPVAPAPQRPTAAQAAQQAGQPGGADAAESTAWFDDAPAVPLPAPGRAPLSASDGDKADDESADVGQASGQDIANMDWPALQAAVSTCTRCALCHSRQAAVPGRGDPQAQWLVLGTAPTAADELEVRAITGEPGQLLDNMLKAIALAPEEDAYVTTLVKCRPPADDSGADRLPTGDELAACRPYLERELELAGTRMILTLGHTAGKGLLGAAARGKVLRYVGIPTIATYHPADLLRKPADKAKAWSDLCLAKAAHAGRA